MIATHAAANAIGVLLLLTASLCAHADRPAGEQWDDIVRAARGQTVYFNAWGGDLSINRYIDWAAQRVRQEYGITLRHVKVTDIAESVTRITAERAAGRMSDGSVDLLWINGENFAALKNAGLLYGPWAQSVPGARQIDWAGNPTTLIDNTLPTEGFELPWGTSVLTLFFERTRVPAPPPDSDALLAWIEQHPGRFTYPQPPAFVGSAFIKQMLLMLAADPSRLQQPPGADFATVTAPLWAWLDRAHRSMWRGGRLFPHSGPALRELLAVGEVDWMMSYNPSEASRAIGQGELHDNIGALHFDAGALGNSHFLAIAFNSAATEGARVVADFLVGIEAQSRKADERFWGDLTVLDVERLGMAQRASFDEQQRGPATPPPPRRVLPEPHASWTVALEQAWLSRYTR